MLTPLGSRVGNLLYFWLQAHRGRDAGREILVRENDHFGEWPHVWPEVARLSVARPMIGRTDRLLDTPHLHFQHYGVDFTRADVDRFARDCLLSSAFTAEMTEPDAHTLTINVRRGDYYSDPVYRSLYGIDIDAYLRRAVEIASSGRDTRRVVVVSDDADWCATRLAWLSEVGEVHIVRGSPVTHLATLASASNLVLSNSTFSYWGGYLAGAASGCRNVVAPALHVRDVNGGVPWQHYPSWNVEAVD